MHHVSTCTNIYSYTEMSDFIYSFYMWMTLAHRKSNMGGGGGSHFSFWVILSKFSKYIYYFHYLAQFLVDKSP